MTTYEQLIQQGEKRGIQKGEQIGIQKGEQIGIQKKAIEIVLQAHHKGLELDFIAEITSLSVEQIQEILQNNEITPHK